MVVLHPLHPVKTRNVEQRATADHLVLGMLDAEHAQSPASRLAWRPDHYKQNS